MEKITFLLLLIIVLFLIYSFLKFKKENREETVLVKGTNTPLPEEEKMEDYENHVISAVIAVLMEGKKNKIRNIFLNKEEKNKKSEWKVSGRYYNMQRRDRV